MCTCMYNNGLICCSFTGQRSQRGIAVMVRNARRFNLGTISHFMAGGDTEWLADVYEDSID